MSNKKTVLSEKNVPDMIIYIYQLGKVKESQLTNIVKNYDQSVKVVMKIVDAGLAIKWEEKDGHRTTWYELTHKGADIAQDLKRAVDKMEDIFIEEDKTNHDALEAVRNKVI